MTHHQNSELAITRALAFLEKQQQTDGGFASYSSPRHHAFYAKHTYRTVFTPALILSSLGLVDRPRARNISARLADFLLQQKSTRGSFNYWVRESHEAKTMPYPDDLDDTFCTLSALWQYDAKLIDEQTLAHAVKLLIATESTAGGPYYTWLAPSNYPQRWRDVDLAVNANIAFFLSKVARPLPRLASFMEEAIASRTFTSQYYPSEYPVLYYITRAYDGPARRQLDEYVIKKQKSGWWKTPLHTALALSILAQCDDDVSEAVALLLRSQCQDGSWPAEAYCLDPVRDGQVFYSGSPALTTAFVVEALSIYQNRRATSSSKEKTRHVSFLQTKVVKEVALEMQALGDDLRQCALEVVRHTVHGKNGHEIIHLPELFYKSLRQKLPISPQLLTNLGKANLYGWMAYTIYDHFLDGEGKTQLLSVANAAHRRSIEAFHQALPEHEIFHKLVLDTFDKIDGANAWEVAHCRFSVQGNTIIIGELPAYGQLHQLAERSLGHMLTPLAVLLATGVSSQDPLFISVQTVLRHYLIAKQLSDDVHDWKEDMEEGRITYVVAAIIKELPPGVHDLKQRLPELERHFWHTVLARLCREITHHVKQAQTALQESNAFVSDSVMEKLLNSINSSVQETYAALHRTENFLRAYQSKDEK